MVKIDYDKENCSFRKLTKKRKRNIRRKVLCRRKREERRTWLAGRLITLHEEVYRMTNMYKYIWLGKLMLPKCSLCKILNHKQPCGWKDRESMKKCNQKSDLKCFPLRIR